MPVPKSSPSKNKTRPKVPPAADDALTQRVRAALAKVAGVTERRMFGSTGFLVRGKLCISARATRLMCRIDPAEHDVALKREGCTTVIMRGRHYRGYVFVAAGAVPTKRALNHWLKLALSHNRRMAGPQSSQRTDSAPITH